MFPYGTKLFEEMSDMCSFTMLSYAQYYLTDIYVWDSVKQHKEQLSWNILFKQHNILHEGSTAIVYGSNDFVYIKFTNWYLIYVQGAPAVKSQRYKSNLSLMHQSYNKSSKLWCSADNRGVVSMQWSHGRI